MLSLLDTMPVEDHHINLQHNVRNIVSVIKSIQVIKPDFYVFLTHHLRIQLDIRYITQKAKTAIQKPKILRDGHPIAVSSIVKYLGLWITKTLTLTFISNLLNVKWSQWVY